MNYCSILKLPGLKIDKLPAAGFFKRFQWLDRVK
jgi:hypothetical protein